MNKGKVILTIIAGVATIGLAYVGYKLIKKGKDKRDCTDLGGTWNGKECKAKDTITPEPTPSNPNPTPVSTTRNDNFPIKFGSFGAKVGAIQSALNKLGASLDVDNDFGSLTQAALVKYGYPISVDSTTYDKIIKAASYVGTGIITVANATKGKQLKSVNKIIPYSQMDETKTFATMPYIFANAPIGAVTNKYTNGWVKMAGIYDNIFVTYYIKADSLVKYV